MQQINAFALGIPERLKGDEQAVLPVLNEILNPVLSTLQEPTNMLENRSISQELTAWSVSYQDRNKSTIKSWRGTGIKVQRSWREKEYPLHKDSYRQVFLSGEDKGKISSFNQNWSRRSREACQNMLT